MLESDTNTGEAMMTRNKGGALTVLVVGAVILLGSAVADIVGFGASPLVFGYKQLAGSAVGAALAIVGAVLYWRAARVE
jgi:hypothetical protein